MKIVIVFTNNRFITKGSIIMKKYLFFFIAIGAFYNFSIGQSLHTPSDIEQLMEKSPIKYIFDTDFTPSMDMPEYPLIQRISNISFETRTEETTEKNHKKAKKAMDREDFEKAEYYLTKASYQDITNTVIKQSLAGVYVENEKYNLALKLYKEILSQNPYDYELHQQLALCHQKLKDAYKAIHHISLAHIYNRNNTEITATMKSIYLENGFIFYDWTLEPQYQFIPNEDSTMIKVLYKEKPWGAYAKCKAIWDFEDNYAQKMQFLSDQTLHIVEEKECLLNAVITYELVEDKSLYPELEALSRALSMKMVDEYILYEKILRENPELILDISQEEIEKLLSYIKKMHTINLIQ